MKGTFCSPIRQTAPGLRHMTSSTEKRKDLKKKVVALVYTEFHSSRVLSSASLRPVEVTYPEWPQETQGWQVLALLGPCMCCHVSEKLVPCPCVCFLVLLPWGFPISPLSSPSPFTCVWSCHTEMLFLGYQQQSTEPAVSWVGLLSHSSNSTRTLSH